MKIKNFYFITINIILLNLYLNINTSNSLSKQNTNANKNYPSMPMISENELKEIMQNAVEEYNRLPEEEKELMSKQIGIKKEELDDIMKEASAFVEEINNNTKKNNSDQKIEENTFNENNTIEKKSTIPQKNIDLKNETKEQIAMLEKAIKTLQTLNLKITDQFIREKVLIDFDTAIISIEKTIYYFLLIKQFLSNNENQILISNTDIKTLINIANKINTLKESIEKLITLNEYESANNQNNLFEKYSIKKKSNTDLKNFLENEITNLKNTIKEIENQTTQDHQSKKEQSKKIINLEYKIDILEKDLTEIETTILEAGKNNNQFKEYQKLLNEALDKIIKNLKNIFINDNAITEIEEIIRKYFPEEYKIGKEKEEHLKKQINNEKKIKEQKGSNGETYTEKNIKHSSIDSKTNNKETEEINNFQSSSSNDTNNDYENDNSGEEQSPFDFPKNLGTDKVKENKNITEKEKTTDEIKNNNNNKIEKENKKYLDLRHPKKEDSNITHSKDKISKNKGLDIIENKLKDTYITIENFVKKNTGNLYTQWESKAFANNLEAQLTELIENFSIITPETIKEKGTKNIFLAPKNKQKKDMPQKFIEPNIENKKYLNEELEKIELSNTKLNTDPLPQAQLIMYQLKDINEKMIDTFQNKKRREEKDLATVFTLLEKTIHKFEISCIKALENNPIPYWLIKKEDFIKKINDQKELIKNKKM